MPTGPVSEAQVVVVGAGPAGATAAYHLARAGVDVLLAEKAAFPREKVCGDGLTPRAVRQLVAMGIDTSRQAGWLHNRGLRVLGGGMRLEMPWPQLASFPDFGLVRPRRDLDEMLARNAQKAGARLMERTTVSAPCRDERTGRVTGVRIRGGDGVSADGRLRAPVVLLADGNSSRLALALGRRPRADRPIGVAVRRYYRSPRHDDDWLESWLQLWDGDRLLPGYGWVFGLGDGTSNVGLGMLNTAAAFRALDYRSLLRRWLAGMPAEWGFCEPNAVGPARGAALPMAFNRRPQYADGVLLLGDTAGLVNPFNGEGIAYAMESGVLAADLVSQALARPAGAGRDRVLARYPAELRRRYGGYFTLGRAFVRLIGHSRVLRVTTEHGLPHPMLMRFALKLLANLTDPTDGDAMDRLINGLSRLTPAS